MPATTSTKYRILKIASCPSLTDNSTLTYHIGCTSDSKIHVRIYTNTGNGFFSKEWIPWSRIQQALKKVPINITSIALYPLFRGKSVNTPSFLLAVLKHEKLIRTLRGKSMRHEVMPTKAFTEKINKLVASSVDLDPDKPPKNVPIRRRPSARNSRKPSVQSAS